MKNTFLLINLRNVGVYSITVKVVVISEQSRRDFWYFREESKLFKPVLGNY